MVLVHVWLSVFKTGQEDGLKERRRMSGRNVNLTVCTPVRSICVSINWLVLPTRQTGLTSMWPCGLHRENKSLNQIEIKGLNTWAAVWRHADGRLTIWECVSVQNNCCSFICYPHKPGIHFVVNRGLSHNYPKTASFFLFLRLVPNSDNTYSSRIMVPRIKE